jgi:ribosomal protein S18 acetylase RimI-like enzyme
MHVRRGEPRDAAALHAVAAAGGLETTVEAIARDLADASVVLFVAVADPDPEPVGFVALRASLAPPACVRGRAPLQLWRLYLRPEFHGKGVARLLTGRALVHASAHGHDVVWLGTAPGNDRAVGFYRKCGFSVAGMAVLPGHGGGHADVVMACLLGS